MMSKRHTNNDAIAAADAAADDDDDGDDDHYDTDDDDDNDEQVSHQQGYTYACTYRIALSRYLTLSDFNIDLLTFNT